MAIPEYNNMTEDEKAQYNTKVVLDAIKGKQPSSCIIDSASIIRKDYSPLDNTTITEEDQRSTDNFFAWMDRESELIDDGVVVECASGIYNKKDQWIKDSIDMVRMDDGVTEVSTYDGIYYMNKLFGPVGLSWDKKFNRAAAIEAIIVRYNSKKELNAFLKESRPLVYILMEQQIYTRILETFVVDKSSMKIDYTCRYFPEVGKLPWWKYQLQFLVNKLPKNKKLRAYFYRLLTTN